MLVGLYLVQVHRHTVYATRLIRRSGFVPGCCIPQRPAVYHSGPHCAVPGYLPACVRTRWQSETDKDIGGGLKETCYHYWNTNPKTAPTGLALTTMTSGSVYRRLEEPVAVPSGRRCAACCLPAFPLCETFSVSVFIAIASVIASGVFLSSWTYIHYHHQPVDNPGSGTALYIIGIILVAFGILCCLVVLAMWIRRRRRRKTMLVSIIRPEAAPPVDLAPIEMTFRRSST